MKDLQEIYLNITSHFSPYSGPGKGADYKPTYEEMARAYDSLNLLITGMILGSSLTTDAIQNIAEEVKKLSTPNQPLL